MFVNKNYKTFNTCCSLIKYLSNRKSYITSIGKSTEYEYVFIDYLSKNNNANNFIQRNVGGCYSLLVIC